MKRNVSFFVIMIGLLAMFAAPVRMASAWSVTPQDVSFTNQQGIVILGKLFKPAGAGPFPAVVMMHGCSGIYSNSNPTSGVASINREWGDRLVAAGYVALLVDSFTPRNAPQNQCGSSVVSPGPQMKRGRRMMVAKPGALAARTSSSAWALVAAYGYGERGARG